MDAIRILGVVVDEVGMPSNDGRRGSKLYAVPFQLSYEPSAQWATLFEQTWDSPPSFDSHHRSGICRVIGDRIILDATTLEEVERTHKRTLEAVLHEVNGRLQDTEKNQAWAEDQQQQRERAYREHVRDIARRIKFD